MRYAEIVGCIRVPLFLHEEELMQKLRNNNDCLPLEGLDEWEENLAFQMTSKGVLRSVEIDGATMFVPNKDEIWRF